MYATLLVSNWLHSVAADRDGNGEVEWRGRQRYLFRLFYSVGCLWENHWLLRIILQRSHVSHAKGFRNLSHFSPNSLYFPLFLISHCFTHFSSVDCVLPSLFDYCESFCKCLMLVMLKVFETLLIFHQTHCSTWYLTLTRFSKRKRLLLVLRMALAYSNDISLIYRLKSLKRALWSCLANGPVNNKFKVELGTSDIGKRIDLIRIYKHKRNDIIYGITPTNEEEKETRTRYKMLFGAKFSSST